MPETPDFEQIAERIIDESTDHAIGEVMPFTLEDAIAEQLRRIWNARGAADIAKLHAMWPFVENIDVALRSLDVTSDLSEVASTTPDPDAST
jgi:hypothetical protein